MSLPKDSFSKKSSLGINLSNIKIIPEEEEKGKIQGNNWSAATVITETPKNQMDIKIRNLVHDIQILTQAIIHIIYFQI